MRMVRTEEKSKAVAHRDLLDAQCEIESKLFKMADLKAVSEIPYRELLEQVDHVVRELAKKCAYDLSEAMVQRLVEVITSNLVRKSKLVAA